MKGPLLIENSYRFNQALKRGAVSLCIKCKGGVEIHREGFDNICINCGDVVSKSTVFQGFYGKKYFLDRELSD